MRVSRFFVFSFVLAVLWATFAVDAQPSASALAGRWQGTYAPKATRGPGATRSRELGSTRGVTKLPATVIITAAGDGTLSGTWTGTSQQPVAPIEIAIDGDTIRFTVPATKASWEGTLSADGSTLNGKWQGKTFQGDAEAPLVLRRGGS